MNKTSPWDELTIPDSDYNVKRIKTMAKVPCYWGRDPSARYLFILELEGNHTEAYRQQAMNIHGIKIDLREEHQQQRLVLTLERNTDHDIFLKICQTLLTALGKARDAGNALDVTFNHLRRWKAFMSGQVHHLSDAEIHGLLAELTFLGELITSLGDSAAVKAWMGPERSHQDFIFGDTAVEIKALTGMERSSVRISSEDQLETLNPSLFLKIYRLNNRPSSGAALSLNELVQKITNLLDNAEALEAFEGKLAGYGYAPLPAYDTPSFAITETGSYKVSEEFPRLIRSRLPAGIDNVTYDIRLEDIEPFRCESISDKT